MNYDVVAHAPLRGVYHLEQPHARAQSFFCIIGSAEALPILCVSDFCERERERERETPVTSLISR